MVNRYWRIYIWTINGKTQTMAVISPNKTIEGFIGGLICSLIVPLVMMFL